MRCCDLRGWVGTGRKLRLLVSGAAGSMPLCQSDTMKASLLQSHTSLKVYLEKNLEVCVYFLILKNGGEDFAINTHA